MLWVRQFGQNGTALTGCAPRTVASGETRIVTPAGSGSIVLVTGSYIRIHSDYSFALRLALHRMNSELYVCHSGYPIFPRGQKKTFNPSFRGRGNNVHMEGGTLWLTDYLPPRTCRVRVRDSCTAHMSKPDPFQKRTGFYDSGRSGRVSRMGPRDQQNGAGKRGDGGTVVQNGDESGHPRRRWQLVSGRAAISQNRPGSTHFSMML